jgi:hypothetical protein
MFQQYFFNDEDSMIYHQNICGRTNKINEMVTSLCLKFPQIMCFVEQHLKYIQIQQISIENCNLGTSICSISSDKGGVCIFIYKSLKLIPVSIKEWCKDKDMQTYAVKCEFSAAKRCISMILRSPPSHFHIFVNKSETIIKNLYKLDIQIIIYGDINTNYLAESNKKNQFNTMLHSCNLHSVVYFPTRTTNKSSTMLVSFFYSAVFEKLTVSPIFNGLADHDAQLFVIQYCNSYNKKTKNHCYCKENK